MPKARQKNEEIGTRVALTKRALGYDRQIDFVEAIRPRTGITLQRWNDYESGRDRIALRIAVALCDRFDLSLDWIYRGKRGELPARIAKAIEAVEGYDARPQCLSDEH